MKSLTCLFLILIGSYAHAGYWECSVKSNDYEIHINGSIDLITPATPFIISGTVQFSNEAAIGLEKVDIGAASFRRAYITKMAVSFDLNWVADPSAAYKSAVDIKVAATYDPMRGTIQGAAIVHKFYYSPEIPKFDKTFAEEMMYCDVMY